MEQQDSGIYYLIGDAIPIQLVIVPVSYTHPDVYKRQAPVELPVYIDKTAEVLNWMKSKSKEELKPIWKCNDLSLIHI